MTTKTIDCVECGESVSYGRLSCPACGALLASVAGSPSRPSRKTRAATGAAVGTLADGPESEVAPNQIELPRAVAPPDDVEPAPHATEPESAAAGAAPVETPTVGAPTADDVGPAEPEESALEPAAFSPSPEPGALPSPVRTPFDGPEPILVARPYGDRVEPLAGSAPGGPPASAYRAPAFALSTATATATGPSSPSASMTVAARSSIAATNAAATEPETGTAEEAAAARFAEIGTWFVIVGAAMSVLGFLLPWSRVVIGSRSLGGYLDNWGLASPTHVVVLLATVAILGLGIMRTTVPVWLWAGVCALALGGILVGLTWPYLFGPLGADVGVIVVGLGGFALVVGGVVTSWATRHVEVEPAV